MPAREVACIYRREVWEGSGVPVGPVDFSRPVEPEPQVYPAPVLTSDMAAVIIPSQPAASLAELARSYGWDGMITFAEGNLPHATHGRPLALQKSEAVRLRRGDRRAVAVRRGGSWTSLWTWSTSQFFTRHATLEAFRTALASTPRTGYTQPVTNRGVFCA